MSGNAATNARKPTLSAAAIGYAAAKKQEEMEAAVVGLQHATITDQLTDLEEALDNNLLTQEEYDLQRSRVLSAEIVEPVVVNVAIAPRSTSRSNKPRHKIILIGGILAIVGVAMFFNFFYYRVVT